MMSENTIQFTPSNGSPEKLKDTILNKILFFWIIIAIPEFIILVSYAFRVNSGWNIVSTTGLLLLVCIFFQFHKAISSYKKVVVLSIILFIVAITSFQHFGFIASGKYAFIIIIFFAAIYLPANLSILFSLISIFIYIIYASLILSGLFQATPDTNRIELNPFIWIIDGMVISYVGFILYFITNQLFNAYKTEVKALMKNEETLSKILNDLPVPIAVINNNLEVKYLNERFTRVIGFNLEEVPTAQEYFLKMFEDTEERMEIWKEWSLSIQQAFYQGKEPVLKEYPYKDKHGNLRWAEIHHSITKDIALVMFVDTTQKRNVQNKIINTIIKTEEKESGRLAKELHDGIGPLLSTAKIYAHSLKSNLDENKRSEYSNRLGEILEEAINEVKQISNNLSPHILRNFGLKEAINAFIEKIRPITNIEFNLSLEQANVIPDVHEFTIYRTITEMINNTLKYANAKNVIISFHKKEHSIGILYADDGIGFNYESNKNIGLGLSNLKGRIENIGGTYSITTSPGKGVQLYIKLAL